jgi:hypothetical protein
MAILVHPIFYVSHAAAAVTLALSGGRSIIIIREDDQSTITKLNQGGGWTITKLNQW